MPAKQLIYGLGGVWLVLFVLSFVMLQVVDAEGSGFTRGLNRIVAFLTWQGMALVAAIVLAWLTRQAVERRVEQVKLVGYLPLAVSVFLIATFVAIVAYRVFVVPLLPSA